MEEILLNTQQSKLLVDIQDQFITSLEVIILSSSALKYLSQTNLFAFFEIAGYYNLRRLTFTSKEVDPCFSLMKEIGFYGCLKTMLILTYVFSEFQQLLPQHTVSSLIQALTEYLKTASIYRNTRNYMFFIHTSLGYLAKSLPNNLANHSSELFSLQSAIGHWIQPEYMPDRVNQPTIYKKPIVQIILADLENSRRGLGSEISTPADDTISKHISNLNTSLSDWFMTEKDLAAVHLALMSDGSMILEDALNVADRHMLNNWIQQMSFSK